LFKRATHKLDLTRCGFAADVRYRFRIKFQEVLDLQYGISHQRRSRNDMPCQAHLSFELKLMKVKLQRFVVFFLSVIYISVPVGAQKKITREPSVKAADAEARNLRKQQLLLLHENLLSRTLDSIKKMDEVALRLSVRNQLLAYLWESRTLSSKNVNLRNLALEAITDLNDHHPEMPPFMRDYLLADLAALIEKHDPDLTEKLKAVKETAKIGRESLNIRSLFELKNGDVLAASKIRQLLAQGGDVSGLNFWLDDLREQKSGEFEPLLREVIAIAARGPQISFETLFWLTPICFHSDVPQPLQRSFAAMILSRTQPANFAISPAPQSAYELLVGALPQIQRLLPEHYEQAVGQSLILRTSINQTQLVSEERNKRLKESENPIEDLVREAEAAKTKSERNELLAEAAETALIKEKFDTCLDVLTRMDLEVNVPGHPGFWRDWNGQFVKKFVKSATAARELEIAEKAALGMIASLAKVEAVASLIRHWSKAGEKGRAHRLLIEAIKVSDSVSDDFEKAKSLIMLSIICDQVDESKRAQLLLSSVKALNGLDKPTTPRDQEPYQEYVGKLDKTGYQIIRGFKALTLSDEEAAIALVDQFQKSDLRSFALIGMLSGLKELLSKAETRSAQ
jgi:hypothetical protein